MNASIEQVLKRLQDCLRIQSAILEQSEELGWVLKDVLEDLVLALNDESFEKTRAPAGASVCRGNDSFEKTPPLHDDSLPKEAKEVTEGVRGNP
jgi:hypothetical protein